jgi:hypothetical protein
MALEAWQKLIATGIEKNSVLDVRAATKTTPKPAPSEPWWKTMLGKLAGYTPVALIPGVRKTPEELRADPRTPAQTLADTLKGAGGTLRWTVAGLIAVAAIVVIPRLFARK